MLDKACHMELVILGEFCSTLYEGASGGRTHVIAYTTSAFVMKDMAVLINLLWGSLSPRTKPNKT